MNVRKLASQSNNHFHGNVIIRWTISTIKGFDKMNLTHSISVFSCAMVISGCWDFLHKLPLAAGWGQLHQHNACAIPSSLEAKIRMRHDRCVCRLSFCHSTGFFNSLSSQMALRPFFLPLVHEYCYLSMDNLP